MTQVVAVLLKAQRITVSGQLLRQITNIFVITFSVVQQQVLQFGERVTILSNKTQ